MKEISRADRVHAAVLMLIPLAKDDEWIPQIAKLMQREAAILNRLRTLRLLYREKHANANV